jgi:hypothetical protein
VTAAKKGELVPRPPKKSEYEIRFATSNARKSWQDLVATIRNPHNGSVGLPHADASDHDTDELPAPGRTRHHLTWGNHLRALAAQADSERNRTYLVLRARAHSRPGAGAHKPPERNQVAGQTPHPLDGDTLLPASGCA